MHDVFVSYEKETKTIADNIVNMLEQNGIRCWYAPRDVLGQYAVSIVNAIKKAKVFILILTGRSSKSNHVLNEVETAYKQIDESGLKILPFKTSDEILSDAMTYYIKRFHWIDAVSTDLDESINKLLTVTQNLLGIKPENKTVIKERDENKYFKADDEFELKRLKEQQKLLYKMSEDLFAEIKDNYNKPTILDVGSNDGTMSHHIYQKLDAGLLIGLEYDKQIVQIANEKFNKKNMYFYQCDISTGELEKLIEEIMAEKKIEKFDILHISMVLLHLKNPFKILRILRKYIKSGGKIIIRDIDDGYNVAYPDEENIFKKAMNIIERNPRWGYRESGRQIYTLLKKIHCENIKQEKIGINTINMSFDEREALYHTYFGSILEDIEICIKEHPNNKQLIEDKKWLMENQDDMEYKFYQNSFYFLLGFVLFSADVK